MSATPQQIDEYVEMTRQEILRSAQALVKTLDEPLTTGWQFVSINFSVHHIEKCWEDIVRNKPLEKFPFPK